MYKIVFLFQLILILLPCNGVCIKMITVLMPSRGETSNVAYYFIFCFPCTSDSPFSMTSELDSSLTSIDWLPQLGISSLRSGKERAERKKDRGRETDLPPLPPVTPASNSKAKPMHSYATLIAMAISSAPERKMSLNDIYTWISDTFPYYSRAGRGWKVKTTT